MSQPRNSGFKQLSLQQQQEAVGEPGLGSGPAEGALSLSRPVQPQAGWRARLLPGPGRMALWDGSARHTAGLGSSEPEAREGEEYKDKD